MGTVQPLLVPGERPGQRHDRNVASRPSQSKSARVASCSCSIDRACERVGKASKGFKYAYVVHVTTLEPPRCPLQLGERTGPISAPVPEF